MSKADTRTVWTEQDYNFLINNYQEMSYKQIGQILNKTRSAIQNKIKILGLKKPDKYIYNHSFFKEINTEQKAYWLGFMYADGYISKTKNGYCCGIELKASDSLHLKKFNKDIEGNIEVSFRQREDSRIGTCNLCSLRLYSKEVFEDLKNLGCVENKSDKITFPRLPENLIWHFLRGFFDGDGCIILNKQRKTMKFDFCSSSLEMLESIKSFLYANGIFSYIATSTNSKGAIERKIPNYRLYIAGMENGYIFGTKLYNSATVYLNRKKEKFDQIVNEYNIKNRIECIDLHGGVRHKNLS